MSCYNWEGGYVKIPTAEWGKMKKTFREQYNHAMDLLFLHANTIYARMMLESKGKRGYNFKDRMAELMVAVNISDASTGYILQSMFPYQKGNKRPFKPQKKAFPVARNTMNVFHQDELTVRFNEKEKTVFYNTDQNNRSVERCEELILGRAILHALRQTVYGRGSGGKFTGNDEYNREDESEGGGANYVTRRFGPLGDK